MLVFDVVYNNAAMQHFGPMPDFSIDDWRATITGELDIPFFVSKFAWPHLVRRGGGVILNVASVAGMIAAETPPDRRARRSESWRHRHDATVSA